jgi:hypothetical protein
MNLNVDWSVPSKPISLAEASVKTGVSLPALKSFYRDGVFGSPRTAVTGVPMHEVTAILVIKAGEELGLPHERLLPILPAISGAAYVRYQLAEISHGRCQFIGGTPMLNIQLGNLLNSPEAPRELEARLPSGPIETKRYACFDETRVTLCDDLGEANQPVEGLRIIDAWVVAEQMKRAVPGERLYTHIA